MLAHPPVDASRLNLVESYFSVLKRRALAGAGLTDMDALTRRILAFQKY